MYRRPSRFNSHPSRQYRETVAALRAFNDDDPSRTESLDSVYAPVASDYRVKLWEDVGYKISGAIACVQRVLGKHCNHYDPLRCRPPGTDHPYLLKKKDGELLYVSEPYDLGSQTIGEMLEFARKHGLDFEIRPERAVHYPSRTMSVIWFQAHPGRLISP